MEQGDCWVVIVDDSTAQVQAIDAFSTAEYTQPTFDTINNLVDYSGYQNATHTLVSFRRAINTGDSQDFVVTPDRLGLHGLLATVMCSSNMHTQTVIMDVVCHGSCLMAHLPPQHLLKL